MGRFSGKVVIVTGSSNGIGRATALVFAKEGARVTVTGRNEARLLESKKALLDAGTPEDHINLVNADVTTSDGQEKLIQETLAKFGGRIDVLVNNAGASVPDKDNKLGISQGIDTYEKVLKLNLQSVIELTQKIRPHLKATKGAIVNVSSIVALKAAWSVFPYYSIAKAAVDQYTRASAIELIRDGIRVNAVNPGIVETGFQESAFGLESDKATDFYKEQGTVPTVIPAGFTGQPHHIANAIGFLADNNLAEYIVGQNLIVDGGTSLVLGFHAYNAEK